LVIVMAVILVFAAREESTVFQSCITNQAVGYTPLVQRRPIFLYQNDPAITAVATVVIAIFTVMLAGVTEHRQG